MDMVTSSVCRACRLRLQVKKAATASARTFTTSSSRLYIPPESPAFVDLPEPLQPAPERRQRVKGLLPVPREVFPRRRRDKPSAQYLQNVTRDPLSKNIPPPEFQTEARKYKLRASEARKNHLREGLTELYARKSSHDQWVLKRSVAKTFEHDRLINQAEREDERLTNNTVPSAMRPQRLVPLSQAEEDAIYEARKTRHEAILEAKRVARLDKLHTLYMNARTFITDKQQMMAVIDSEFEKPSIWKLGVPSSLRDMVAGRSPAEAKFDAGNISNLVPSSDRFVRDQDRMKRIAEKLSGGKL